MKRSRYIVPAAVVGLLALGGGGAAYAVSNQTQLQLPSACVKFGAPQSIIGNYMLWNWNNSLFCPPGTYPVYFSNKTTIINPTSTATVTAKPTVTPTVTTTVTVSPSPTPTGTSTTTAPPA